MTWLFEYGRYAVQIFLVMGGYLAAQSLTRASNLKNPQTVLKTIFNRYLRLFAPYVVALLVTIACAWVARFWVQDEFVGESETMGQFLAHLFFLQGILGLDSISAGVWYVAIDWQLYSVLAILLISFSRYQSVIWIVSILAVFSLLVFNRSSAYEAYFIYFIGSYGLGVLSFLASRYGDQKINRPAKTCLLLIGLIIAISSFQQIWLRNLLAMFVAIILLAWGDKAYPANAQGNPFFKGISWGSKRSYCAFLIHFAFILLANTLYIAMNLSDHESGMLAIAIMLAVLVSSVFAANYLYKWIEVPSAKLKV